MSWKDHLTPDERQELLALEVEKARTVRVYNSTWRKLKARCDARQRRWVNKNKDGIDDAS